MSVKIYSVTKTEIATENYEIKLVYMFIKQSNTVKINIFFYIC